MYDKLIIFDTMSVDEMYRMVHEIYAEGNRINAKWRNPELENLTEAIKEEETSFMNFLKAFMSTAQNSYYILEIGGQWVSALRLTRIEDFYYLEALETAEEHRKKGYAAKLILKVIALLKKQGQVIIRSNVAKTNPASLATHKKCGFTIEEGNGTNHLTGQQRDSVYGMLYVG